jgi:hypothetical protein
MKKVDEKYIKQRKLNIPVNKKYEVYFNEDKTISIVNKRTKESELFEVGEFYLTYSNRLNKYPKYIYTLADILINEYFHE